MQRCQHPRVRPPKIFEVEMAGMFAAEDSLMFGHQLLYKRMANATSNRLAAILFNHIRYRPRTDQVIDDCGSRVFLQLGNLWQVSAALCGRHDARELVGEQHLCGK